MQEYDPLFTMSVINMAVVSLQRITSSRDRLILDREYDSIINNLRIGEIKADPELKELCQNIVKVIQKGRLRAEIRDKINIAASEKKRKGIGEIIKGNVFRTFSLNPLQWFGKLALSSAAEYFSQQAEHPRPDDDSMSLTDRELDEYGELQSDLLGSSWSLLRQYHLPDNYRLTQKGVVLFSVAINEPDPQKRSQMFRPFESDFAMYAPYWFYRAKSAKEAGNDDEAGKYFARFSEVWRPVLRKDPYRAEVMKYEIEGLMREGVNNKNAGEILKCLEEMRANTELDDWANNIFAGMVYLSLGFYDEAKECVINNVNFRFETEASGEFLDRIRTEELPPEIDVDEALRKAKSAGAAEILIEKYCAYVNARNSVGETVLMSAGNAEVAEVLIKHGADVNAEDDYGRTALMWAGNAEVAEVLLKHGADVNAVNNFGGTALMWAENAEVAEVLIKHGADVNAKDNDGNTALMQAAEDGNAEIAEVLIKHGANINARNNSGKTALMLAANDGNAEIAEILIKHGADVNTKDNDGNTALMSAAYNGHAGVAEILIKHGADVNAKDNNGRMALMSATINGYAGVAAILIKHGADVNAKDNFGWTALMSAAGNGHAEIAEVLIKHGADVNAKNEYGHTALKVATYNDNTEVADVLTNHGAR